MAIWYLSKHIAFYSESMFLGCRQSIVKHRVFRRRNCKPFSPWLVVAPRKSVISEIRAVHVWKMSEKCLKILNNLWTPFEILGKSLNNLQQALHNFLNNIFAISEQSRNHLWQISENILGHLWKRRNKIWHVFEKCLEYLKCVWEYFGTGEILWTLCTYSEIVGNHCNTIQKSLYFVVKDQRLEFHEQSILRWLND